MQNSNSDQENNLQAERSNYRSLKDSNEQLKTDLHVTETLLNSKKKDVELFNENIDNLLKVLLNPKILATITDDPIPKAVAQKIKELKDVGE
ncbi:hypothetical protein IM793_23390 [Pedobacter sp. MR2016-19]|uniref:hypothetical protein n=1 Tax=Pedobacter sp. MR2016-19 TaxID=2780089 RepID=UPI001874702E|nr:hypothetical protein [Pedobacter sp. MR2016-19]MBE5322118.1 hypothetical protein [Pedobacter sp. MR2016-19]